MGWRKRRSDDQAHKPAFQVRPLSTEPEATASSPTSPPPRHRPPPQLVVTPLDPGPGPAAIEPAADHPEAPSDGAGLVILARFPMTATPAALALVAASPLTGLDPGTVRCGQEPSSGAVLVPVFHIADAEVASSLGGTVYMQTANGFASMGDKGTEPTLLDLSDIRDAPLPWLVSQLLPRGRPKERLHQVLVATTGRLAGRIIRQCQRSGAEVTVSTLRLAPLTALDETEEAVLLRISSARGIPPTVLAGLADLPGTLACRETERLIIDIRFELPVSDSQLAAEVPSDERWLVGGADVGSWVIAEIGPAVSPTLEFTPVPHPPPPLPGTPPAPGAKSVSLLVSEARLARVLVVPAMRPDGRTDAVLLDDGELDRLKRFLARSPLAETAFLIPGPGRHLLTEPGGLLTAIPYGVPVHRIGPGGLYLEAAHQLSPPVPAAARPDVFGMDGESVIVLCADGTWRLNLSHMVPAWSLWLGTVPDPVSGLSDRGRQLLAELGTDLEAAEWSSSPAAAGLPAAGLDRGRLLDEAARLEQRGRLGEAARRLEESGDLYRAAILYELAAREVGLEQL